MGGCQSSHKHQNRSSTGYIEEAAREAAANPVKSPPATSELSGNAQIESTSRDTSSSPVACCKVYSTAEKIIQHEPLPIEKQVAGSVTTGFIDLGETNQLTTGIWEHSVGSSTDVEADEVFVILSGKGRIHVNGEILELFPGAVGTLSAGIAKGDYKGRDDTVNQALKVTSQICGAVGSLFGAGEFVAYVINFAVEKKDQASSARAKNFILSLECDESKNHMYMGIIAREVVYRFGAIILKAVSDNQQDGAHVHDAIVRVGTIRMLDYAMRNGIGLEDSEGIFIGLIQGYQGIYGKSLKNNLGESPGMFKKMFGEKESTFTVEGLFARSGFVAPADLQIKYWVKGKGPKDNNDYGHVRFKRQFDARKKEIQVTHDNLVPKYGYVSLPHESRSTQLISSYAFIAQHTVLQNPANFGVQITNKFQFRYASEKHVIEYLKEKSNLSFNAWLSFKYPQHFARGISVHAIVRNAKFDDVVLKRPIFGINVSFSSGNFEQTDFSSCEFKNIKFSNMKSSLLLNCVFENCEATGTALSRADLSFSTMTNCVFREMRGFLTLWHVNAVHCDFAGSDFQGLEGGADIGDQFTRESFDTASVGCGADGKGGVNAGMMFHEMRVDMERRAAREREINNARIEKMLSDAAKEQNRNIHVGRDALKQEHENLKLRREIAQLEKEKADKEAETEHSRRNSVDYSFDEVDDSGTALVRPKFRGIPAYNNFTMALSVEMVTNMADLLINQVYDTQYFNTAVSFLRNLQHNTEFVGWRALQRRICYDTSGKDGEHGKHGRNGQDGSYGGSDGSTGHPGIPGKEGKNATDCEISLMVVPGQNIFLVSQKNKTNPPTMLPLYDGAALVELIAKGGKGGTGGNGGKGGDGSDGRDGIDATRHAQGTSGTNGGRGGNGGDGAHGGNSGNSGNIYVNVKEHDIDLLYLIRQDCSAVPGGRAGAYGLGGMGGNGGRGGKSYSYSEQVANGCNSDGVMTYRTEYHTIAGGNSGTRGNNGGDGQDAHHGEDGVAGDFVMKVFATTGGAVNEYSRVYNLCLIKYSAYVSDTGIIEPGQALIATDFNVGNVGGMPSPANGVVMSIVNNPYLAFTHSENKCEFTEVVQNGYRLTLSPETRLDFNVIRMSTPVANTVVEVKTPIVFKAELFRVKKEFTEFAEDVPHVLHIQYPVELSVIRAGLVVTSEDTVPITIKVKNISLVALGMGANNPRHLVVNVYIPNRDQFLDLQPVLRSGTTKNVVDHIENSLSQPFAFEIRYLGAQSEIEFTATLALKSQDKTMWDRLSYQRLPICCSLALGDIDRPTHDMSVNIIQNEIVSLQIAELREKGLNAVTDLLLVCNSNTTKVEINHWASVAKSIELSLVVWNVSVYNGFSYTNKHYNLMENFKDGLVVFLNTPFNRSDDATYFPEERSFMPISYLEPYEIFEAARRHGIRTYVINTTLSEKHAANSILPQYAMPLAEFYDSVSDGGSIKNSVEMTSIKVGESIKHVNRKAMYKSVNDLMQNNVPNEHLPATYEVVTIKKVHLLTTPTEHALNAKLKGLKETVAELNPSHTYFFKKSFAIVKLGGAITTRYQCGQVEVRRGLDTTYAMIASRFSKFTSNHCDHIADKFVLLKLMKFSKKLEFLVQRKDEYSASLVLSDLIDEQVVYFNHVKDSTKVNKDNLLKAMTTLSAFATYSYADLVAGEKGLDILKNLIVKLRYFASFYASPVGTCFGVKPASLKGVVKEVCNTMMTKYFPTIDVKKGFKALRNEISEKMFNKTRDFTAVALAFTDPYNIQEKSTVCYNHTTTVEDNTLSTLSASNSVATNTFITKDSFHNYTELPAVLGKTTEFFLQHNKYRKAAMPHTAYYCDSSGNTLLNNKEEQEETKVVLHSVSHAEELETRAILDAEAKLITATAVDSAVSDSSGSPSSPVSSSQSADQTDTVCTVDTVGDSVKKYKNSGNSSAADGDAEGVNPLHTVPLSD